MENCLIGYTGFVGSNLLSQGNFNRTFNSKNIESIKGQRFDTVYCAGVYAEKWRANKDPETDIANIRSLLDILGTVRTKKFVLISTVDVYANPNGVDENTPIDVADLHPYGKHRYFVEQFVTEHFQDTLIARLPGLFGSGLKKNIIYDIMHDNEVEKIHSEAIFQFYNLDRIFNNLTIASDAGVNLINLATEPVSVREIAKSAFGTDFTNIPDYPAPHYDFQTVHSELFGQQGQYIEHKQDTLKSITNFVSKSLSEQ